MASAWIERRIARDGTPRFRVRYRVGGRETTAAFAGSFKRRQDAVTRQRWVLGELAALRVPNLRLVEPVAPTTLREVAERWRASRVDVSEGTMETYYVSLNRLLPRLGDGAVADITAERVAALVAELHAGGLRKQSIRKTVSVLAMVLDHARVEPNPARDKQTVKLPREKKDEPNPPTAEHLEAVIRLLPSQYQLPLLVLDATGMRVGELGGLTWGDVDELRTRWRVCASVSKTGKARWVAVPEPLFRVVCALVPRDDRVTDRPVFQGFGSDRFRTALTRACVAAGVPAFSPHDLRHRRISLLHLAGEPWARIGQLVGHDDMVTTMRTYTHVLLDERELDYEEALR